MAFSAIFLTIIISGSSSGFKIGSPETFPGGSVATAGIAGREFEHKSQPIAGYPKVPPPNAHESGGSDEDLLPPLEDSPRSQFFRRSVDDVKVDPKTGYPLEAQPFWKYSGGDEKSLELPLEDPPKKDDEKVDPKTGYPLEAHPEWRDAGGDGDIIALPFEDTEDNFGQKEEAVDPKTGYPLKADPRWKDAGGNEDILQPPLEDEEKTDPKTGYPLVAQESWKHSGGDGDILQPPVQEAVDPKTGYPLVAQPGWRDAGGDGDILETPLEDSNAVDPKTGYPLSAQPSWKDAGGNGDILQLPLEGNSDEVPVDPKTGYPLVAQPSWKDAGGDGDILQLPFGPSESAAGPSWVGGNQNALELPLKTPSEGYSSQPTARNAEPEYEEFEIFKLTQLQPPEEDAPGVFGNFISGKSSVFPNPTQKRNSSPSQSQFGGRPVEATYTYTGPDNVVVTVTRFLSNDRKEKANYQSNLQNGGQNNFYRPFSFHDSSGTFGQPVFPR